ncbi:hypothetical protein TorRG33x02_298540 [Trema orientale]|uniref:Protein PHYTOCHROME KINASE SUBSTRATE 4 n=1 Tax=Trema orientale TaxID=63057 RepID=A0A2P5C3Y2_TREOI|nr:hypothetical protein TorRG33x02_298540 [Trema orientale]
MDRSAVGKATVSTSTTLVDDSTEISIFDAQKYFNELNLLEAQKSGTNTAAVINGCIRVSPLDNVVVIEPPRLSSASSSIDSYSNSMYRNYMRTRSFRSAATPTASSEASWNSQTGLLSVPPGSMGVSLRSPLSSDDKKIRTTAAAAAATTSMTPFSAARWLSMRRKCPCSCKKSVQVNEKSLRTRSSENHDHLPIPQIVLPPQTPSSSSTSSVDRLMHSHILRVGGNTIPNGTATSKSSVAEIRSSSTIGNNSFEENWGVQPRRSRNSRDTTRSFSSSSAMEMSNDDRSKLQVSHGISAIRSGNGRLSFTEQQRRCGTGSSTSTNNATTATGFTFPILSVNPGPPPPSSSSPIIKMTSSLKDPAISNSIPEDPARDSLEIFRPPSSSHDHQQSSSSTLIIASSRKNSEHFMRSSSSDANRSTHHKTFTFPASPTSRMRSSNIIGVSNNNNNADVDDVASDASSDLFEIESFSTQTTTTTATTNTTAAHPSMFLYHCQRRDSMEEAAAAAAASSFQSIRRFGPNPAVMAGLYDHHHKHISRRTSLDEPPMMTPAATAECYAYEPSEASIDWSVTTAEGFDRASVANASEADYGEFLVAPPEVQAPLPEKSRRRSSGNGLLMSCRCEKAVSVGPGPRPVSRPVGPTSGTSAGGGDYGRPVGPGVSVSSSSTLAMWAVGHKR